MPTYEYQCNTCKRHFEKFQSITEQPLTNCPFEGCTGTVSRLISSGAGLIFKGTGFYETDYKKKSATSSSGSTTSSSAKSE